MATIIPELQDASHRRNSVLMLYGTGVSMWQYYPFLRQFTLSQLETFDHIYGISGGAACLWYYVLSHIGLFHEDKINTFDSELRSLNEISLVRRIGRLIGNKYVYETSELARGIERFASPEARRLRFADFPLSNFTAIGFDYVKGAPVYLNRVSYPDLAMGDAMSALSFPRIAFGRKLCRPIEFAGLSISDFDFAPASIREETLERLKNEHATKKIYIANVFYSRQSPRAQYLKCGHDSCPRTGQLIDLILLLLNVRNPRLYRGSI
jgi:hypothetical protein